MITLMQTAPAPPPREATGFFTDATLCIGCKACEVACKQWNQLPADGYSWSATSYDNTRALGAATWRHVAFIEQDGAAAGAAAAGPPRWLMASDVCKHCERAPCEEACPTGALVYNEFHNVYVQQDICNGCGYCVSACPFGVLDRAHSDGRVHKCTLCYDRQRDDREPACAQACPTKSIRFGPVSELRRFAADRLEQVRERGESRAYLYGAEPSGEYSALNAFFLLTAPAQVYNLPAAPRRPAAHLPRNYLFGALSGRAAERRGRVVAAPGGGRGANKGRRVPAGRGARGMSAPALFSESARERAKTRPLLPPSRSLAGENYYGIPFLKRPTWRWQISHYFFFGGLAGGSFALGALADAVGGEAARPLRRAGYSMGLAGLLPCPVLLIWDLGLPRRFPYMLRVWKPSSPMNLGAWILTAFGGAATVAGLRAAGESGTLGPLSGLARRLPARAAGRAGLPLALAMTAYSGALLAGTSNPVWSRTPLLSALFTASSFASASEAIRLEFSLRRETHPALEKAVARLGHVSRVAEDALLFAHLRRSGAAGRKLRSGRRGAQLLAGAALGWITAALAPSPKSLAAADPGVRAGLLRRRRQAALLGLAGGALIRWALVHAGRDAADDIISARAATRPDANAPGWGATKQAA